MLSISVLSVARGIASEDLDRPNEWRHHESETNVQTEDVQATHWMHSMTTRGIVWKIIEFRSHGWRCCFRKQMLSNFVSAKRPFPRANAYCITSKAIVPRLPPPPPQRQCVICLTPQGHLSTNGSETFPGTTSRQLNLFSMMMLNTSLDPKPNAINGPQCKILTDMAMALFFQYQQCNFSRPIRLQFLWKDAREILALKASLRISLVPVWNHLKSTCNVSASNPQRLEQGARLGQLCRYKRERTKITRSSRWSLCRNVCT